MAFIIFVVVTCTLLLFVFLKLFLNPHKNAINTLDKDQSDENQITFGMTKLDLHRLYSVNLSLAHDSFDDFKNKHSLIQITQETLPRNTSYHVYFQEFNDSATLPLNLILDDHQLTFNQVQSIYFYASKKIIDKIEFETRWSDAEENLENAYLDYKKEMQKLINMGCKYFFALEDIRYKKQEYSKILKSSYHECLAPDLLTFSEFKEVLEDSEFISLDSFFYLGDFHICVAYSKDFSVTFEIECIATLEVCLGIPYVNQSYLVSFTEEEKIKKFNEHVEECLLIRAEEEEIEKAKGYEIDETYVDPFAKYENLRKDVVD